MLFQPINPNPSHIILQAIGLWKEYMLLHHPMKGALASTDSSSMLLNNAIVPMSISLQKGKAILEAQLDLAG